MSILQPYNVSRIHELRGLKSSEFSVGEVTINAVSLFFHLSLHQLGLYGNFGVLVAGVPRSGQLIPDTALDEQLQDQDVLLLLGKPEQIEAIKNSEQEK